MTPERLDRIAAAASRGLHPPVVADLLAEVERLLDSYAIRLKSVRSGLGLKSAEMAAHLGLSSSKYSQLETGKSVPKADAQSDIDAALERNGVPAGWLTGTIVPTSLDEPAPTVGFDIASLTHDDLLAELGRRLYDADLGRVADAISNPTDIPELGTDQVAQTQAEYLATLDPEVVAAWQQTGGTVADAAPAVDPIPDTTRVETTPAPIPQPEYPVTAAPTVALAAVLLAGGRINLITARALNVEWSKQ